MFTTDLRHISTALSEPWRASDLVLYAALITAVLLAVGLFVWQQMRLRQRARLEQLRKQIARDFHDEMGSKLSVIGMYSELIRHKIRQPDEVVSQYLDKIIVTSSGLYASMKDLIWSLDPGGDALSSLLQKVWAQGQEMFESQSIQFTLNKDEPAFEDLFLPVAYKRHLLLILKESMHNAFKHAACNNFSIQVKPNGKKLEVLIRDDGQGFEVGQSSNGEGLKSMQDRARQLGGTLELKSGKGGTAIRLAVPMPGKG